MVYIEVSYGPKVLGSSEQLYQVAFGLSNEESNFNYT